MLPKLFVSSLCFVLVITFSGCTDEEVIGSSIVVGGILIGSAIHDRDHHRPHPQPHPHRPPHSPYPPPHSPYPPPHSPYPPPHSPYPPPHDGHHGPYEHYYNKSAENESDLVTSFAQKYQLTDESAQALIDGIYALEKGDLQAVYQIGFSEDSLKHLAMGSMVEEETIDQIGINLNMEEAKVKLILADFQKVITAQMKDVNSDYWQKCMATGKWKTNFNSYCKDVNWSGCGPDSLPGYATAGHVTCFAQ